MNLLEWITKPYREYKEAVDDYRDALVEGRMATQAWAEAIADGLFVPVSEEEREEAERLPETITIRRITVLRDEVFDGLRERDVEMETQEGITIINRYTDIIKRMEGREDSVPALGDTLTKRIGTDGRWRYF